MRDHPIPEGSKKWTSLIWPLYTAVVLLLVVLAGAGFAILRANHSVDCQNTALGGRRAVITRTDAQAHIDNARALQHFLGQLANPSQSAREKAFEDFIAAQNKYVHTLVADQAYRNRHPLGSC